MKGKWRTVAIVVLSVILLIGIGGMVYSKIESNVAKSEYDKALQMVKVPTLALDSSTHEDAQSHENQPALPDNTDEIEEGISAEESKITPNSPEELYMQDLSEMDVSALQAENKDVIGWIVIPNTTISYPLLQGEDNQYYLKHTWKKNWNTAGAIFLDYRNSDLLTDFNTIIYGHRRKDETMFSPLLSFKDQEYANSHQYIYLVTEDKVYQYAVFSAHYDSTSGSSWRLGLNTTEGKQAYIDYCLEKSLINGSIMPKAEDKILTLSTCSGLGDDTQRFVVHGVLINN